MILVDTSVWIDYLRTGDAPLSALLNEGRVLTHSFVTGELALGNLRDRRIVLDAMRNLPQADVATDDEVLRFTESESLFGIGIGYVDAHLLAAVRLTHGALLWTRDKRLLAAATRLCLAAGLPH